MFNLNYNIIHNDSKTGRTDFLIDISRSLNGLGLKLFFFGCTSELDVRNLTFFNDYRITSTNEDYNNLKLKNLDFVAVGLYNQLHNEKSHVGNEKF